MHTLWHSTSGGAGHEEVGKALTDKEFAVFLTKYGPALWPAADPATGPPVIVLSVPKSGTYFTEALYKRMGYHGVRVHAMDAVCNDYRVDEIAGLKGVPITILSRLVLSGQVIVSHCSRNAAIETALTGFKKIYLYRNLREIFISHARGDAGEPIHPEQLAARVAEFCKRKGTELKAVIEAVSGWRNDRAVFAIDFADLTSPRPARREALAARFEGFMGWPKTAVITALRAVPGDETPTRSEGGRSRVDDSSWDEQCEAWFSENMADVQVVPDSVLRTL
jgi:hypothetical protein